MLSQVYDLADMKQHFALPRLPANSILAVLENWAACRPILGRIVEGISELGMTGAPLSEVRLETPIRYPQSLYCAGANYVDHLEEMTGEAPDKSKMKPFFFLKPPRPALVASGASVGIPEFTEQLDWEAEIALVIGKEARSVGKDDAMDYVAGFTILNDLSARDLMKRYDVPFLFDWIGQKCFMGSAPAGPWITPTDFVEDPQNLDIKLWVNETLHQDSNSSQMIFGYAEQIAYLSKHITLYPGDLIATGTPAGVGHAKGVYLRPGDVIRVEVSSLGELTTYME